jgi:hypothetical protein
MNASRTRGFLLAISTVLLGAALLSSVPAAAPPASPWKFTKAMWKYDKSPAALAWYQAERFDGAQCWSPDYHPQVPYCGEIRTGVWPMDRVAAWINNSDPLCFGYNVDCEVGRTALSMQAVNMIHARGLKAFTGPMPWDLAPQNTYAAFDGIMTFYAVSGSTRFPEDVFYFLACAPYYGKPVCIGIQPVSSDGTPVDAAAFAEGLTYASNASARIIWGTDRLIGSIDTRALAVTQAIAKWPTDIPRQTLPVRFLKDRRRDMALCRIAAYKGYLPVASLTAGLSWSDLVVPSDYPTNLAKFCDTGATKAAVERQEQSMVWRSTAPTGTTQTTATSAAASSGSQTTTGTPQNVGEMHGQKMDPVYKDK